MLAADPQAQAEWARHGAGVLQHRRGRRVPVDDRGRGADIQLHTAALPFGDHVDPAAPPAFTTLLALLTPRARGSLRLRDADPGTPPVIDLIRGRTPLRLASTTPGTERTTAGDRR